ncbi:hypothetical protein Tco_1027106 [Tanacetum coccineum]
MGCCLTSWFSKKQTALAISMTEPKYVSARKACQQALRMKQALIDYDIRLDDVPIMCDNKERKTQKDYGTRRGRSSNFSSFAFDQPSSSHLDNDNDGNDKGTSRLNNHPLHALHHLHHLSLHLFPTSMASTQASSFNGYKKIKLTIISPRQLFVDLTNEDDSTFTPYPITTSSYPTPPNAPSKTPSTKDTLSTFRTTSSSFKSKPESSPTSSNKAPSPQPSNPFLDDILDVPKRPLNPVPL